MINLKILFILIVFFNAPSFVAQEKIKFSKKEQEWIADHPVVRFGFDPNWPPFEMYDNGEYSGIIADYINQIEIHTGIKMEPVEVYSFKETIDKLRSGEIHVAPEVGMTPDRNLFLEFTDPYLTDPQVLVTRVDSDVIKGLSGLSHKIVSQPQGVFTYKKN